MARCMALGQGFGLVLLVTFAVTDGAGSATIGLATEPPTKAQVLHFNPPGKDNVAATTTAKTIFVDHAGKGGTTTVDLSSSTTNETPVRLPLISDPIQGETDGVTVPNLSGLRLNDAMQRLRTRELRGSHGVYYVAKENWKPTFVPGSVYIQTPTPKSTLQPGGDVACWVLIPAETKQKTVAMPDLRGLKSTEAATRLTEAGLQQMPALVSRSLVIGENATVNDHFPKPGQSVYVGTSVYLQWRYAVEKAIPSPNREATSTEAPAPKGTPAPKSAAKKSPAVSGD